jgi:predicted nuclease with TOPRIM domain
VEDTNEILKLIWHEIKALGTNLGGRIDDTNSLLHDTNSRLAQTNSNLNETNRRIEKMRMELGTKLEEMRRMRLERDIRLGSAFAEMRGAIRASVELLQHSSG